MRSDCGNGLSAAPFSGSAMSVLDPQEPIAVADRAILIYITCDHIGDQPADTVVVMANLNQNMTPIDQFMRMRR
jgi:hypothetical protein